MKIVKDILDKCNTIEELLDIKTDNGKIRYSSLQNDGQDYSNFKNRYKFFKKRLASILPELSAQEILKFYEVYYSFTDTIFEFDGHADFMSVLYFEQEKGLL